MNNPVKIIYKYKNLHRAIQYNVLIFIGNLLNEKILNILKKIEKLSFYDSLIILSISEIKQLEEIYGHKWFSFFFITKHILYTQNKLNKNIYDKEPIIKKLSLEWYNTHIYELKNLKKTKYNFAPKHKNILEWNQNGGNEDDYDDEINDDSNYNESYDENEINDIVNQELNEIVQQEIDYKAEKNYEKISELIEQENNSIVWNSSKDNNQNDDNLNEVYIKTYITFNYIYNNDTIETIKKKICASYEKASYLNTNDTFINPKYIYLW